MFLRILIGCLLLSHFSFAQKNEVAKDSIVKKPTIDKYQIISLTKDTTYVDTSLTIQNDYQFNYLRKDNFGLMSFSNIGQTYNRLKFNLKETSYVPQFGFDAKHYNYLENKDVTYYRVPTAYSQLYYRSVMEQGQNVDALFTVNLSERFNFSVAYKGLRSIGKYINMISSTGNFRFTTSYASKNNRYVSNAHIVYQDIYNGENGGIKTPSEFEGGTDTYKERGTIDVNLRDASTMLKGNRFFLDHSFRINSNADTNDLRIHHQITADKRFFYYKQSSQNSFFGDAFVKSNIGDRTDFRQIKNQAALSYTIKNIGQFKALAENNQNNYYYNHSAFANGQHIPNIIKDNLSFVGGEYQYKTLKFNSLIKYVNSLNDSSINQLLLKTSFLFWKSIQTTVQYEKLNKRPDYQALVYQSKYIAYNWNNSFLTEKSQKLNITLTSKYGSLEGGGQLLTDWIYYSNDSAIATLTTPKQFTPTITYTYLQLNKEVKFRKIALDNTLLYQQVQQSQNVLNVPAYVLRNTLYYSDVFFKKALFLQMGITFNYFSSYYSDTYNPLIGSFYVQNQKAIGSYPVLDVFVNAKVKTARLFLKAEHVNSSFSPKKFYSDPNNPYRDFVIRFGMIWSFFN